MLGGDAVRPIDERAIVATASDLFLNGLLAPRGSPSPGCASPFPQPDGAPPDPPEARPVIEFFVLMIAWLFVMIRWITGGKGYE